MRKKAYMLGREMIWSHVAHLYMESFQRAGAAGSTRRTSLWPFELSPNSPWIFQAGGSTTWLE